MVQENDGHLNGNDRANGAHNGHLKLINNIRSQSVAHLHAIGITRLHQLCEMTVEDLLTVHGIGPTSAPRILAHARAWVNGAPVWWNSRPSLQHGIMLDIEGDPTSLPQIPWCFGWCDVEGRAEVIVVMPGAPERPLSVHNDTAIITVPSHAAGWARVERASDQHGGPVYHWSGYDAGSLRATAPRSIRSRLLPRMHDLHKSFTGCVTIPRKSTSIKVIADYLGYAYQGYQDWEAAWNDYCNWRTTGDTTALLRATAYQADDAIALAVVWRWMNAQQDTADFD
jgi:predicted RecB family nuclease